MMADLNDFEFRTSADAAMKQVIELAENYYAAPASFGLGMVQLKLTARHRLHFYHPSLSPIVPEEEFHTHRYAFISRVLRGVFSHQVVEFRPDSTGTHKSVLVSCNPNSPAPSELFVAGTILDAGTYMMSSGSSYRFPVGQFHRVVPSGPCVTLLMRKATTEEFAMVLRENGAPAICPFGLKLSMDECWAIIQRTLHDT